MYRSRGEGSKILKIDGFSGKNPRFGAKNPRTVKSNTYYPKNSTTAVLGKRRVTLRKPMPPGVNSIAISTNKAQAPLEHPENDHF